MTPSTRTAMVLVMFAQGLAGCDGPGLPSAPSTVAQPNPQPPPNHPLYTLTPSLNTVTPGGQLSVSWTASRGRTMDWIGLFWIGLFSMGVAPCHDGPYWYEYTNGATSGIFTLTAPTQPGHYEFRYYRDDACVETARSGWITVSQTLTN